MSFALYPDPPVRALSVPAGGTVFTLFAQRSGHVAEFDPPYPQVMFLRVAMLGGSAAPALFVAAGSGTPVEVSVDPQGVFSSPGDVGYVGDVSLKAIGANLFEVMMGLVSVDPALVWRLGIRNTDTVERFFTWVVADSLADTAQPWVDPGVTDYQVSATIPIGGVPNDVGLDGGPTAYICDFTGNSVLVIDVPGRAVATTIPVGQHPESVAVDTDAHTAYVANSQDSTISVIDTITRTVIGTIPNTAQVTTLAVDPARGRLYAGCGSLGDAGGIAMIRTDTHSVIDQVPLARRPFDLAVDPTAHTVYATDFAANELLSVDPETFAVSPITLTSNRAFGVAVDPVSHLVYVSCRGDNAVVMIDPRTGAMTPIPVGQGPARLAVDPGAYTVFVAHRGEDTVGVIDTRTGAATAMRVGRPQGVAVDPISHTAVASADTAAAYAAVIERRRP